MVLLLSQIHSIVRCLDVSSDLTVRFPVKYQQQMLDCREITNVFQQEIMESTKKTYLPQLLGAFL